MDTNWIANAGLAERLRSSLSSIESTVSFGRRVLL